jgi:hypothetical protein
MDLSSEDALRLKVLLANNPLAIRIDESSMTLYALNEQGENKLYLNPNCRDDLYLRQVRETLSGHILGSPGGYPVYLKRWSRMGQTRDEHLEHLLLLGEPEGVVAVTSAKGLTNELARRAWWVVQEPDNARRMLENPQVVQGDMGPELARYLIEYLPFETEPIQVVETLRLALQPGLIGQEMRTKLWEQGARGPIYYLGFLASTPSDLMQLPPAKCLKRQVSESLHQLADEGNIFAITLLQICGSPGQGFLTTCLKVMEKPANQDVITTLLDVIRRYFRSLRPGGDPDLTLEELQQESQSLQSRDYLVCSQAAREYEQALCTLYLLSGVGYGVVRPVFSKTDAIGALMRKKLLPVMEPLKVRLQQLLEL